MVDSCVGLYGDTKLCTILRNGGLVSPPYQLLLPVFLLSFAVLQPDPLQPAQGLVLRGRGHFCRRHLFLCRNHAVLFAVFEA